MFWGFGWGGPISRQVSFSITKGGGMRRRSCRRARFLARRCAMGIVQYNCPPNTDGCRILQPPRAAVFRDLADQSYRSSGTNARGPTRSRNMVPFMWVLNQPNAAGFHSYPDANVFHGHWRYVEYIRYRFVRTWASQTRYNTYIAKSRLQPEQDTIFLCARQSDQR